MYHKGQRRLAKTHALLLHRAVKLLCDIDNKDLELNFLFILRAVDCAYLNMIDIDDRLNARY